MEPQIIYYIHQLKTENSWTDPAVITAIMTVAIAVMALFISIQQTWQNIRHNRLSIQPHLQAVHHYKDGRYTFSIENIGLGPAYFEKADATLDDQPAPDGAYSIAWLLNEILPNYRATEARVDTVSNGCALSVNESLILFSYECPEEESDKLFEELKKRAVITISYKSAYNIKRNFVIPGGNLD